jgi:hypothetical protein
LSESVLVTRGEGLIQAEVDGEMVALHVDSGTCYGFNLTATRVWALLEQPKTIDQLCEALTGEFEVEPDACKAEVTELLEDLERDGLVSMSGAAA